MYLIFFFFLFWSNILYFLFLAICDVSGGLQRCIASFLLDDNLAKRLAAFVDVNPADVSAYNLATGWDMACVKPALFVN